MSVMVGRRDFLRGKMTAEVVIRPPRAIPETDFLDRCDGCGDCVEACPQNILDLADNAPRIDFSLGDGACIFCDDCTEACPTGALDADSARPWSWKAEIIFPDCLFPVNANGTN
jgi:ferredoxin-type protein NapF